MKKFLLTLLSLAVVALPSCINDGTTDTRSANSFNLRLSVADIGTGVEAATRASVAPTPDEVVVNSLYLLFFDKTADQTGAFVDYIEVQSPVMSASIPISLSGTSLSNTADYSILALANIEDYISTDIASFITLISTKSEKLAIEQTALAVGSDPNTAAPLDYTTKRIPAADIPMSAQASKGSGEMDVTVKLTRGVSRFDVYNNQSTYYEMVSVSVWGAATSTPLWFDKMTDTPVRSKRFYGMQTVGGANIEGGLYAFENFVSDPQQGDEKTTCLIIGMKALAGAPVGTAGTTYYYRVNVHPEESSQNLKRNYVYKVTVRSVNQEGYDSEYNAWKGVDNRLTFTINNWNLDDEGLVLTDGVSTLVVPVKRVRLSPDGDSREYSIYTLGTGTLSMSKSELPGGFDVTLTGNLLKVTAEPLGQGISEKRGSIELSFGSLRGTIDFIQSPNDDVYLELNKSSIGTYPNQASAPIPGNEWLIVNSSGPWTAKIYNNGSGVNPGFSFSSSSVVTELTFAGNSNSNQFMIYTTGENPTSDSRNGFVVVSLDGYEDINRALVLTQRGQTNLTLTPHASDIVFLPTGAPQDISNAIAGDPFVFYVNGGSTDGVLNAWDAQLQGAAAEYFTLTKSQGYEQKVEIRAKGCTPAMVASGLQNLSGEALLASVKIWLTDAEFLGQSGAESTINITHLPVGIGLEQVSGLSVIPATGTQKDAGNVWSDYVEFKIKDLHESLTWKAFIDKAYIGETEIAVNESTAFFIDDNGNRQTSLTGMATTANLMVGFDKIYYPLVNQNLSVRIRVEASNSTSIYVTKTVVQTALTAKPVKILDIMNDNDPYGSITYGSGAGRFIGKYSRFIRNTKLFGTTGTVKTKDIAPTQTGYTLAAYPYSASSAIPGGSSGFTYVHMGGRETVYTTAHYASTENWRMANDGVLVWPIDVRTTQGLNTFTNPNYVYSKANYVMMLPNGHGTGTSSCQLVTDKSTRIMKYLLQDGPFTNGTTGITSQLTFYRDDASTGLDPNSLPEGAVAAITYKGTTGNGNGAAMLVIDPKNKLVYIGESQMLYGDTSGYTSDGSIAGLSAPATNHDKFLCNLLAYIINASMYGSHFTDIFVDDAIDYPFISGFVAPNP